MSRSMTAYGRSVSSAWEGMQVVVELHSVNRKGIDIRLHAPKELLFLDLEVRQRLLETLLRGQVTVRIAFEEGQEQRGSLSVLGKLKKDWEQTATALGYPKETVTLSFLLQQMERLSFAGAAPQETQIKEVVFATLERALESFMKMKEAEGHALDADIKKRLKLLAGVMDTIEQLAAHAPATLREKLLKRLEELVPKAAEDERFLKEIALMADKTDITEEIIRMRSHLKQTEALFKSKEPSIGRSLDFLVQEMGREVNTIGSKTGQLEVTEQVLVAKQELEKIKEQAQNIE